jgi:hypothetical protein
MHLLDLAGYTACTGKTGNVSEVLFRNPKNKEQHEISEHES